MVNEKIAITGIGIIVPEAFGKDKFWQNIIEKKNCIKEVPHDLWDPAVYYSPDRKAKDKTYSKIGGFIENFKFDPIKYKMPPATAKHISRLQKMTIEAVRMAMEDSGYDKKDFDRTRAAVVIGNTAGPYAKEQTDQRIYKFHNRQIIENTETFSSLPAETQKKMMDEYFSAVDAGTLEVNEDSMPGELPNVTAGRISNIYNFNGPNLVVDAACASSLAALDYAVMGLRAGRFDMAVCGGADEMMSPPAFIRFSKVGALSPDGSYPFDEKADGFVMCEGVAVYTLKRLSSAVRDGDKIYALINAVGAASDGKGKGVTAPNPKGQKMAIEDAFRQVDYTPADVDFVEAHGTGTKVGDTVEMAVLKDIFGPYKGGSDKLGITSVKSQIGHCKSAAGAVSVVKTALALSKKVLPPTINCTNPNKEIDLNLIKIITEPEEWKKNGIRRADVSAFGFGGADFHVLMEEYTGPSHEPYVKKEQKPHIPEIKKVKITEDIRTPFSLIQGEAVTFTGNTPLEVLEKVKSAAENTLPQVKAFPIAHYAQPTMLAAKGPFGVSIAVKSAEDFKAKADVLLQKADEKEWDKSQLCLTLKNIYPFKTSVKHNKVAFMFPGQGSQYVDMLRDLAAKYRVVRDTFDEADEILSRMIGIRLTEAVWSRPDENKEQLKAREQAIKETKLTQPAMMTADIAMFRLLCEFGIKPDLTVGHSLGEYAAATAAGIFTFENGLRAVTDRASEMSKVQVADTGKMASVALGCDKVDEVLKTIPGYVISANKNCPIQTVIAGEKQAVDKAVEAFKMMGVEAGDIPVSHAFHSAIMQPAVKPYSEFLRRIPVNHPKLPILSNVTADLFPDDREMIYDLLIRQMVSPVEFIGQLNRMYDEGVRTFIECGPKRVLSAFAASTLKGKEGVTVLASNHPKRGGILEFNDLLANMTALGIPVDWKRKEPLNDGSAFDSYYENWALSMLAPERRSGDTRCDEGEAGVAVTAAAADAETAAREAGLDIPLSGAQAEETGMIFAGTKEEAADSSDIESRLASQRSKDLWNMYDSLSSKLPEEGKQTLRTWLQNNMPAAAVDAQAAGKEKKCPSADLGLKGRMLGLNSFSAYLGFEEAKLRLDSGKSGRVFLLRDKDVFVLETLSAAEGRGFGVSVLLEAVAYDKKDLPLADAEEFGTAREAFGAVSGGSRAAVSCEETGGRKVYVLFVRADKKQPVKEKAAETPAAPALKNDSPAPRITETAAEKELPSVPAAKPVAAPAVTPVSAGPLSEDEITGKIISIMMEKTGYPEDMLNLDDDMEADLGIDTVKQAEIFAIILQTFGIERGDEFALKDYPTIRHCIKFVVDNQSKKKILKEPEKAQEAVSAEIKPAVSETVNEKVSAESRIPDGETLPVEEEDDAPLVEPIPETEDKTVPAENIPELKEIPPAAEVPEEPEEPVSSEKEAAAEENPAGETARVPVKEDKAQEEEDAAAQQELTPSVQEEAVTEPAPSGKRMLRYVPEPSETKVINEELRVLKAGVPVLIFSEDLELAKSFRSEFQKRNVPSYIISSTHSRIKDLIYIDYKEPEKTEPVIKEIYSKYPNIQGILYLNGCTVKSLLPNATSPMKDLRRYVLPLFFAAKYMPESMKKAEGNAVPFFAALTTLDGAFGYCTDSAADPIYGALFGFMRSLRKEISGALVKLIDFDPNVTNLFIADKTMFELLYADRSLEAGYSVKKRSTVNYRPAQLLRKAPRKLGDKTILVTGGGRGLGALFCERLARRCAPRLLIITDIINNGEKYPDLPALPSDESAVEDWKLSVLLPYLRGNSQEPGDITPVCLENEFTEIRDSRNLAVNLEKLRSAGTAVHYVRCDLGREEEFRAALEKLNSDFGKIDGVVHFAGYERSRTIGNKNAAEFEKVFGIKAASAAELWKSCGFRPNSFKMFISSVIGKFGNKGQTDYAAASEYLAQLGHALKNKGERAFSVCMSAFSGVGMSVRPGVGDFLRDAGVDFISPDEGIDFLIDELIYGNEPEVLLTSSLGVVDADRKLLLYENEKVKNETDPFWTKVSDFSKGLYLYAEKAFDAERDGFLSDHSINGIPYVPAVLGMETFARAVARIRDAVPETLTDIKFDEAIKLFKGRPAEIKISAEEDPAGGSCRLSFTNDIINAKGVKIKTRTKFSALAPSVSGERIPELPEINLNCPPANAVSASSVYSRFFHGPAFQVLASVPDTGAGHSLAIYRKVPNFLGQPEVELCFIPSVFEALLQTCAWQAMFKYNCLALPVGVSRAVRLVSAADIADGTIYLYAKFKNKSQEDETILYDAWAFDADRKVYAFLGDCSMRQPLSL